MLQSVTFAALGLLVLGTFSPLSAKADDAGFLSGISKHSTLASTAIDNGDLNPYALVVVPASAGSVQKNDVLIDNFNDISNAQGTGTTIVKYSPVTKDITLFARVPKDLPQCPGGVGLTTAMTMLKSGWVIVGSTPSADGTTKTKGTGCLIVIDANGKVSTVWANKYINGPWGNMATIDNGSSASIFVSMAGFDVPGAEVLDKESGNPVIVNKSTVVRFDLSIPAGKAPTITKQTIIADGLSSQANKDTFLVGPTGVALGADSKTLYVSDAVENSIIAIDNAPTRTTSAGKGREIAKAGLMKRPLAMALAPNGHLLVTNAVNGQVVEIDPISGKTLYAQWIDANQAQTPPGSGDLFGIALAPDGKSFYYVEDDINALALAH